MAAAMQREVMEREVTGTEALRTAWASVAGAAAAASAVVVLALSTIGRLTATWGGTGTGAFHILDSAAYGAIIGGAAGSVLLAAERARRRQLAPRTGQLAGLLHRGRQAGFLHGCRQPGAALLAGAAVGAVGAAAGWLLDVRRGSVGALLLFLAGSVAFGAAVGAAARPGRAGTAAGGYRAGTAAGGYRAGTAAGGYRAGTAAGGYRAGTAAVGGAIGGFGVWLAANALHGVVAPTTSFASWRALAEDPAAGERFLRHGVGAALPAVLVPLSIAALEELRRLWRG